MFEPVSPQPDFAAQEEEVLAFWQREKIFEKSVERTRGGETFVIYDGPPYANAKPPLHTMVPMSFKDLVGRYQTMRGRYVPRQAGWDTHGLPIEVQVEKALGLASKKDILSLVPGDETASIRRFNEICRQSVFEFKQEWDRFVPRVGYWTDLEGAYITYEPEYISRAWGVFRQVWDRGLAYKGYKVLPYCPRCGTGLSTAEVAQEYHDTKDVSVFVSFPLADRPGRSLLAWTTTPWTLPGNVGLAVGPEIDYVAVRQEAGEYLLAKSRLEVLRGEYEIIEEMKGKELVGLRYLPPFPGIFEGEEGRRHEVLAADFVSTEDGTGIVHTAVLYGEDDFNLGQREGLVMRHTVGPDGSFLENVPELAGQNVRDALVPILRLLEERDRLYAKQTITHSYPFCWRCKTALIYYAKESWFIAMSRLRQELVANNETVEWIPAHIRDGRFGDFIREARDWAVSRERFWGIPLPIWVAPSGKQLCIGSLEELRRYAKHPEQVDGQFDPHRPMVDEVVLEWEGEEYRREPFVLDIWFDSGAMPYASGREEQGLFPADYIAEAVDQTRGWFYHLLALGTSTRGQSPFRRVVCMGHLVDEHGKKMSKSGPNSLVPWEVFQQTGVDALRWWLYTVNAPGEAKAFSLREVQASFRKSILLLWNVFNYFLTNANLHGFAAPSAGELASLGERPLTLLDRWMLSRQESVLAQVTAHLDDYDFMRAGRLLERHIDDLSTWYLRRSRKRSDPEFFLTLYHVLLTLATMMAPLVPFISEKIYRTLRRPEMPESVHLCDWPLPGGQPDAGLEEEMAELRRVVELGLSVRAAAKVKVRQPLATAYVRFSRPVRSELLDILAEELNVLEVRDGWQEGLASRETEGLAVALDTELTDELLQAGLARELLRQVQQLRKQLGLQPGQVVTLRAGLQQRASIEPLLAAYPSILEDAYLRVDPELSWGAEGGHELELNGQTLLVDLLPD